MSKSKFRTLIIYVFCIAFLSGCSSASNISPEIVCGKWQMYTADTGRNSKEQKQPITYTFMQDGKYVSRLTESTPEETTGKWEIKDGKLLLSETKNGLPLDKNGFMLIQEQRSRIVRFKNQEDKP